MATREPRILKDGFTHMEGGMDSGRVASLLPDNQCSFAINTTFRGGYATCRYGFRKILIDWQGQEEAEEAFKDSLFQGGFGYTYVDSGEGVLLSSHGGRQFRVNLRGFVGSEITPADGENNPTLPIVWGIQAENFFIFQDGQSLPVIFNGASTFRPNPEQIPTGRQMAYYGGRIWLSLGTDFIAGNIVFGPPEYSTASILNFNENDFLNEGGSFGVPAQFGEITSMNPIASVNSVLGQGELIIGTAGGMFAVQVPFSREAWKTTAVPLMRVIQLVNGPMCQASVVPVNEDLFYRARDGQRSLAYSVRNAGQWGNRSISNEMVRILAADSESFLSYGSGALYDNRLFQTASPGFVQGHGVYHRCLTVLDFDLITNMRETLPPAWEGIWTGLRMLRIVTVTHLGVQRCFIYALNADDEVEIWEMTKDSKTDFDGESEVRIEWSQEDRSFSFGDMFSAKRLEAADLFVDRLSGEVDFTVEYRPDAYPCWLPWQNWTDCATTSQCDDTFGACVTLKNYQEQYRPKWTLQQPPDTDNALIEVPYRKAFEFQTRRTMKGFCRIKQFRLRASIVEEIPNSNPPPA